MTIDRKRFEKEFIADNPAEEVLLQQIIQTWALIDTLEADIEEHGVSLVGARGQPVANPSVAAVAKQRSLLAKLLGPLVGDNTPGSQAGRALVRRRKDRR